MTTTTEGPAMPAAKKTAAAPKTSDKPADVSLNLDTLEREGGAPEPFVFVLGGDRFVCKDLMDEDWQTINELDEYEPEDILRALLGPDRYAKFKEHRLPMWKLDKLVRAWREHTGMLAQGELFASSPS